MANRRAARSKRRKRRAGVLQQLTWSEATNLQIDIRSSEDDRRSEHDLCGISVPKAAATGPRQRDGIRGSGRGRPHRNYPNRILVWYAGVFFPLT